MLVRPVLSFRHAMQVVAKSFPAGGKTIPYFLSVPPRISGCQGKRGPASKAEVKRGGKGGGGERVGEAAS